MLEMISCERLLSRKSLLVLSLAVLLTACGGGGGGLLGAIGEALALNLASGIDAGSVSEASAVQQLLAAGF